MSDEYLTKEEIRRWRSSVEKITLEEYAARLGKKIQEAKKTNDLADLVYKNYNPTENVQKYDSMAKLEKIDITPKIVNLEKSHHKETVETKKETKQAAKTVIQEEKPVKATKEEKKEKSQLKKAEKTKEKDVKEKKETKKETKASDTKKQEAKSKKIETTDDKLKIKKGGVEIEFSKALTDREEKVLDYFIKRRGEIVFAKDLAELLDLKRDYIYKYIKNLRAKMTVDLIMNADNGGFKLS